MKENKLEDEHIDNSTSKTLVKSGVWYIISNFLLKSISFITIPIFTRILTKNEYGQFNNYLSWLQIMTVFVTLNLSSSMITAKYDCKENMDKYTLSCFCLSSISVIIWFVLLNLFSNFFTNISNLEIYYINCMMIYLFFYSAISLFQMRAKFFLKYKTNVLINIINHLTTAILAVCLVIFMKDKLQGRILGAIIPTIVIGLVIVIYLIKKGREISLEYWKYALRVSLPYIPHSLSLILLASLDKIMINDMCGSDKTALYSLACNCVVAITLLAISLNDAYAPWLGDKLKENKTDEIKSFSKKYILIFLIIVCGAILVMPEVLLILGGKEYSEAKFIILPIALGAIYQFIYTLFVNIEQFQKKTVSMSLATTAVSIINYILNLIYINKFGYIAAAYTTVVSYIILLLIHMSIVYKIGYSKVYDYKFIYLIMLVGILIMGVTNILYLKTSIRYFTIILYMIFMLVLVYKNKESLIKEIKKLR